MGITGGSHGEQASKASLISPRTVKSTYSLKNQSRKRINPVPHEEPREGGHTSPPRSPASFRSGRPFLIHVFTHKNMHCLWRNLVHRGACGACRFCLLHNWKGLVLCLFYIACFLSRRVAWGLRQTHGLL